MLVTLTLALLLIAVVFFFARRPAQTVTARSAPTNIFSAVELVTGPECCAKARVLSGLRHLASEAPVLPIEGCTRAPR